MVVMTTEAWAIYNDAVERGLPEALALRLGWKHDVDNDLHR